MEGYQVILLVLGIFFIVGAMMFFVAKLFMHKQIKEDKIKNGKVSKRTLFYSLVVISGMLVLAWFKESGHTWAIFLWAGMILTMQIVAIFFMKNKNEQ